MNSLIYKKHNVFVLYVPTIDKVLKLGYESLEHESDICENFAEHQNMINIYEHGKLDDYPEIQKIIRSEFTSVRAEWIDEFLDNLNRFTHFYSMDPLYSNLMKHKNNITVCGTNMMKDMDPRDSFEIKLSFLFQVIHVTNFLNNIKGICHRDMSHRNIWFKHTDDAILEYFIENQEYQILSGGYIVQVGDLGEYIGSCKLTEKCSDLFHVVRYITRELGKYNVKGNMFADQLVIDEFDLLFKDIYNNMSRTISEHDYKQLLDHDIFLSIRI